MFSPQYIHDLDYIEKLIKNPHIEYISFDIFDTLLVRPVIHPYDIWSKLQDSLPKNMSIEKFISLRKLSEKNAKDMVYTFSSKEEPSLKDIYMEFQNISRMTYDDVQPLLKKEIEIENHNLTQRFIGYQIYNLARQYKKKIIAISDTYFDHNFITSILHKNKYRVDRIFLSSDIGLTKKTGNIYVHILKELSTQPHNILHFGDNYISDIQNTNINGIKNIWLPKTIYLYFEKFSRYYSTSQYLNDMQARLHLGQWINDYIDLTIYHNKTFPFFPHEIFPNIARGKNDIVFELYKYYKGFFIKNPSKKIKYLTW